MSDLRPVSAPAGHQQAGHGPAGERYALSAGWRFGGTVEGGPLDWPDDELAARAAAPGLDDTGFALVNLPHTVVPLSWRQWEHRAWEKVWTYRKHFDRPAGAGGRLFLDFEAANVTATVTLNGVRLGRHFGGYLPFSFEVTGVLRDTGNVLAVLVDGRFNLNVPPNIPAPAPSEAIDFWQPAGIHGTVTLRAVAPTFIADVAAIPRAVLDPAARRVELTAFVDSAAAASGAELSTAVLDASGRTVAQARAGGVALSAGRTEIGLTVEGLADAELWDVDAPVLYHVRTTITLPDGAQHQHHTRIGFREARFEPDGFYLNGRRRYLFGANRHQHFPYAGFAMPARVQRRDAELLRQQLNCVMVRCSHYPQSAAFLDACDELGLLVWEEPPGWQYVGDDEWRQRFLLDLRALVERDRNRPSVIIWAARLNETGDHPELYRRSEALVKALDDSRATSGTTHSRYHTTGNFQHDVFSYDDYTIDVLPDGDHRPALLPPRPDFPYLIAETVTSWSSPARLYRRTDGPLVQQHQAMDYAYVHNIARGDARYAGVLAWSGIDYQAGHVINHRGLKTSGLLDTFRVPKPGAAMYRAQVERSVRVVLEPAFTWDPPAGQQLEPGQDNRTAAAGPGKRAVIFSNCERVEVRVGGAHWADVWPDTENFPNLVTAPSFVDLGREVRAGADLQLTGYVGDEAVITRRYSGDRSSDALWAAADDPVIVADAVDATRVELSIRDAYGEPRGWSQARVAVELSGPGVLVGEPEFDFAGTGAVGAVWIRSRAVGATGLITLHASHESYGDVAVMIEAVDG